MPSTQSQSTLREQSTLEVTNLDDGETVHQRAVLFIGQSPSSTSNDDFLIVTTEDESGSTLFPPQNWPISDTHFKALIILTCGINKITLEHRSHNHGTEATTTYTITYLPLLQTPPLHLAIMIAKDSPLLIDCPPVKRGGITSAHSSLDATLNKFRMTAYMWQALTAEDFRSKGLGRRSFRLEEEWGPETLSSSFADLSHAQSNKHMRSTAKIHLIRSEKTVSELRDPQAAQQMGNPLRRDDLHKYFSQALQNYGGVFSSSARPIVAGLILDSTFVPDFRKEGLIVAHGALGCSNPEGLSLGMFGSHLTYSWPRFVEEVASCLLDTTVPGETVGNDNNQCGTMWEACSIGHGAFLHEVGHAFGADHTSGIMERGYQKYWPRNFLSRTAWCEADKTAGLKGFGSEVENEAVWDLKDALSFRLLLHFRLPSDPVLSREARMAAPKVEVLTEEGSEEFTRLLISSASGIVRIQFEQHIRNLHEPTPTIPYPLEEIQYTLAELESRFPHDEPLYLEVLPLNGRRLVIRNVWALFRQKHASTLRIPGSEIVFSKKSVSCLRESQDDDSEKWSWAMLLNRKGKDGKVHRATEIDSRVGCLLDGAIVYYEDGQATPCGPRWQSDGSKHMFGGGESERFDLDEGVEIVKIEVGRGEYPELNGLRFYMSDGSEGGNLNHGSEILTLEPREGERIVGFFGQSSWGGFCGIEEFGILTVLKGTELPDRVYEMDELRNTDGGTGERPGRESKKRKRDEDEESSDDDNEWAEF